MLIFGHRGASHDAPENTLAAFREAWNQSADGIEGDFQLTRDGHLVCLHDPDTLRTTGTRLPVADSTLAQLRQLEYGGWRSARFAGEPIPVATDILACMPAGKWLVMELKCGPEIVAAVHDSLSRCQFDTARLLLISFDDATVAEAKRMLPSVRAHWLTEFARNAADGSWQPGPAEIIETIQRCGADGLGAENRTQAVTPQLTQQLARAGIDQLHIWTVDQPTEANYYRRLGAWAVTTNRPRLIRQSLAELSDEAG